MFSSPVAPAIFPGIREVHRILELNGAAYLSLHATDSVMCSWYRLHAILCGKFNEHGIQAWLNANTEGECQTDERENKLTKT